MIDQAARKALRDETERLLGRIDALRIDTGRLLVVFEEANGKESRLLESVMQDLTCASSALRRTLMEVDACERIAS